LSVNVLEMPIKCATCDKVTIFEVTGMARAPFSFDCPGGHSALNAQGGSEIVDLKEYDRSQLPKVTL
jgi:hypothetical protein